MPRKPETFEISYPCPTCENGTVSARIEVTSRRPLVFSEGLVRTDACGRKCEDAYCDGDHEEPMTEAVEAYLDREHGPHWKHPDDWSPESGAGDYDHIMREARKVK